MVNENLNTEDWCEILYLQEMRQARDSDFKRFTYPRKRNYEILNPIKFLIKISERFVIRLSCGF